MDSYQRKVETHKTEHTQKHVLSFCKKYSRVVFFVLRRVLHVDVDTHKFNNQKNFRQQRITKVRAFHKLLKISHKVARNFSKSCSKVAQKKSEVTFYNKSCSKKQKENFVALFHLV